MLKETGFKSLKAKPHFQFLEFAYIFQRAEAYIGPLAGTLRKVIKFIGFDKLVIPYWMGQTLVIAKKERSV